MSRRSTVWLLLLLSVLFAESCVSVRGIHAVHIQPAGYPPIAVAAHVQGEARVAVEISPDGSVSGANFISGSPLFKSATLTAAKEWAFVSSSQHKRTTELIFDFRIKGRPSDTPRTRVKFHPPNYVRITSQPVKPTVNYQNAPVSER